MQPHQVLGVTVDAAPAQIRDAYRRRAKQIHPDRGGDAASFHALAAAYHALVDEPTPAPSPPSSARVKTESATAVAYEATSLSPPSYVIGVYVTLVVAAVLGMRALAAFDIDAVIMGFQIALAAGVLSAVAAKVFRA